MTSWTPARRDWCGESAGPIGLDSEVPGGRPGRDRRRAVVLEAFASVGGRCHGDGIRQPLREDSHLAQRQRRGQRIGDDAPPYPPVAGGVRASRRTRPLAGLRAGCAGVFVRLAHLALSGAALADLLPGSHLDAGWAGFVPDRTSTASATTSLPAPVATRRSFRSSRHLNEVSGRPRSSSPSDALIRGSTQRGRGTSPLVLFRRAGGACASKGGCTIADDRITRGVSKEVRARRRSQTRLSVR